MNRALSIGIIILGLCCVAACNPVKVYTEKSDFIDQKQYQSFAILNEVQGKAAFDSPIMEEQLQSHLIEGMEKRGFIYNSESPDLIIRYNTDVTQNQRTVYPSSGWGMWNPWMWGMPMAPQTKQDNLGEVIVDFIDPQADRVIMRATAVGTVNNSKEKRRKIGSAVEKILKEFSSKLTENV